MDLSSLLLYVNRISIFFFGLTLAFLFYETYLLWSSTRRGKAPSIPDFSDNVALPNVQTHVIKNKQEKKIQRQNPVLFLILIALLLVFGFFGSFEFIRLMHISQPATTEHRNIVTTASSKGIKVYDSQFKELSNSQIAQLKEGGTVFIGIEKIAGSDVDMARFRINSSDWKSGIVTNTYSTNQNVYYITYTIATGSGELNIEAQLHSQKDGWIGN